MCTYIYLNHYPNGYLYVGSHTWSGPEGVVDPNYNGSSAVAKHLGIKPVLIDILEVVSEDRKYVAEQEWIIRYCLEYGIAPLARTYSFQHDNRWATQFKNGVMLNCQCNTAAQMHNPDVYARSLETRRSRGLLTAAQMHNSASWKKMAQTNLDKGNYERIKMLANTPEVVRKRGISRCANATQFEVTAPDGSSIVGTCYSVTLWLKERGISVSCNGMFGREKYKKGDVYCPTRGALLGYSFKILKK